MTQEQPMRYPKPGNFTPEPFFSRDHPTKSGLPRCQSWNPNYGRQCNSSPMKDSGIRCESHGGKTPKGLASPNLTRGGIYSKYLPVNLLSQYEGLLSLGQDLFKIDDETAVVTVLLQKQLGKIESGESGIAWQQIKELYQELTVLGQKQNKSPEDIQKFNRLFVELGDVISGGSMSYGARNETVDLVERKRKLVADQRKDWAAKYQAMSFDRVLLLLTAMAASIKRSLEKHIVDDKDRRSVLSDTQEFLDRVL